MVADNDQTDGDAATSFTVSTTDADPGTIHVDMRGSEFTELTSIRTSYLGDLDTTISGLEGKFAGTTTREGLVADAKAAKTKFFSDATAADPSGSGVTFATSGDINREEERVEGIADELLRLEGLETAAEKLRADFFGDGGNGSGFTDSAHLNQRAAEIENLGNLLDSLRGTHTEKLGDETAFYKALSDNYPVGQNIVFDDISDITAEQSRLDGIVQSLTTAKKTHQDEIAERDAFSIVQQLLRAQAQPLLMLVRSRLR